MGVFANTFNDIANAIKAKDGGGEMTPAQMPGRIEALPIGTSRFMTYPRPWRHDGNTHIWFNCATPQCSFRMRAKFFSSSGSISVDYGDGSVATTYPATAAGTLITLSHNYSDSGDYEITISGFTEWKMLNTWYSDPWLSTPLLAGYAVGETKTPRNIRQIEFGAISHLGVIGKGDYSFGVVAVDISSAYGEIYDYFFFNNVNLTSIEIPNGITKIGSYAFKLSSLNSVIIGDGVTEIGMSAFEANNISSLVIGSGVSIINPVAFLLAFVGQNATITMKPITPPSITSSAVFDQRGAGIIERIIVPRGSLTAYQNATNWSQYASIMEEAED